MILAHTVRQTQIADRIRDRLMSMGLRAEAAFNNGRPGPEEVLRSLAESGSDTVMIFPLTIAEGPLTVEIMPGRIGMPDNSCSYTYVGSINVTIRFMTALGQDPNVLDAVFGNAVDSGAKPGDGVVILLRDQKTSSGTRMAERIAETFRSHGFPDVEICSIDHGGSPIGPAVERLVSKGCPSVVVAPMFLTDAPYADLLKNELGITGGGSAKVGDSDIRVIVSEPIGHGRAIIDSVCERIPDDW